MPLNERLAAAGAALLVASGTVASEPLPAPSAPEAQASVSMARLVADLAQKANPALSEQTRDLVGTTVEGQAQKLAQNLDSGQRYLASDKCGSQTVLFKEKSDPNYTALQIYMNRQGDLVGAQAYQAGGTAAEAKVQDVKDTPGTKAMFDGNYRVVTGAMNTSACPAPLLLTPKSP